MEDFLREYYSVLTKLVELIAAITAILVYKKYKSTVVKYFLWFLVYVFFLELLGGYTVYVARYPFLSEVKDVLKGTLIEKNYWWYNLFWGIGSVVFYTTYFMTVIDKKEYKIVIGWSRAVFVIAAVSYILFNIDKYFTSSLPFNYILGSTVILICTTLYFLNLLKSDKLLFFYRSVNFYIAAVIFIWYLVVTPLTFFNVYYTSADWDYVILRSTIMLSMNIFMYLTFTFALLCCKPQNV